MLIPTHGALADLFGGDLSAWSEALGSLLGRSVSVTAVRALPDPRKAHGMTDSVEISLFDTDGTGRRAFLKRPAEELYGETLACDSAREAVWRLEGYPRYPGHAQCVAAGQIRADRITRIDLTLDPFCLLEWALPGEPYASRLAAPADDLEDVATTEARLICQAMVSGHTPVGGDQGVLYRRSIRDALINPAHRLLDSAHDFWSHREGLRALVEYAYADWRIMLSRQHHRLRHVHHDYHPWNVCLDPATGEVTVLGARLPGYGDPFDDLAAFLVNYLWLGHATSGSFDGVHLAGFEEFRRTYLELTADDIDSAVFAPFLAKRLLVLLNPRYYPAMPAKTVRWLEGLLVRTVSGSLNLLHCDAARDLTDASVGTAARGNAT